MNESKFPGAARIAGKTSVDKALELLKTSTQKSKKRKPNKEDREHKILNHCLTRFIEQISKIGLSVPFAHTYALLEMRNALANEDWTSMHQMFSLLLKCYHGEAIIWRYAVLMFLCSPASDQSHFQEFIEMCIGNEAVENGHLLEQLMSLQNNLE